MSFVSRLIESMENASIWELPTSLLATSPSFTPELLSCVEAWWAHLRRVCDLREAETWQMQISKNYWQELVGMERQLVARAPM